jgi:hypothetical protein
VIKYKLASSIIPVSLIILPSFLKDNLSWWYWTKLTNKVLANSLQKPCHSSLTLRLSNLLEIHAFTSTIEVLDIIYYTHDTHIGNNYYQHNIFLNCSYNLLINMFIYEAAILPLLIRIIKFLFWQFPLILIVLWV